MKATKITLLLAIILFFAVCICGAFLLTRTMHDYKDKIKANPPAETTQETPQAQTLGDSQ